MKKIISAVIATAMVISSSTMIFASDFSITTNGNAVISVQPDVAYVNVGVSSTEKTSNDATKETAKKIDTVINALVAMGIDKDDIVTSSYFVYPKYDYSKDEAVIKGYSANHDLSITINNIDKVGEVIDCAVENGATSTGGISFGLKDASEVYEKALLSAVENAINKGNVIAKSTGVYDLKVISVSENSLNYSPAEMYVTSDENSLSKGTTIQNSNVTISAYVTVVLGK